MIDEAKGASEGRLTSPIPLKTVEGSDGPATLSKKLRSARNSRVNASFRLASTFYIFAFSVVKNKFDSFLKFAYELSLLVVIDRNVFEN